MDQSPALNSASSGSGAGIAAPTAPPASLVHSQSEEQAKKDAACEAAEKLNEKIGKVKGKVVVSSHIQDPKKTPSLLAKDGHSPLARGLSATGAPEANSHSQASSGTDKSPNFGGSLLSPSSNAVQGPAVEDVSAAARTTSVHAHFLLDDVVHAGSRSRSGSATRERNTVLPSSDSIAGPRKKSIEDQTIKPKTASPAIQPVGAAGPSTSNGTPATKPESTTTVSSSTTAPADAAAKSNGGAAPPAPVGATNTAGDPRLPQDDGKLHILLAATGSVSTGKLRPIIHKLTEIYGKDRASIQIILTKAAENFVSRGEIPSHIRIWRDKDEWATWKGRADPVVHIELRRWADILVIAPLSANTLGKIALGLCDNLLTCVVRAWNTQYPILIAPAMVSYAYNHPATRAHLKVIKDEMKWIEVLKPVEKVVGSYGDIGMGGMMDWNEIVNKVVLKLGGYPEDEDDEDDNGKDGDDNENENDNEDNEDEEDDDDTETFKDAVLPDTEEHKGSLPHKAMKHESFDEDVRDAALKKLSLADHERLGEAKGNLRHAHHTFS